MNPLGSGRLSRKPLLLTVVRLCTVGLGIMLLGGGELDLQFLVLPVLGHLPVFLLSSVLPALFQTAVPNTSFAPAVTSLPSSLPVRPRRLSTSWSKLCALYCYMDVAGVMSAWHPVHAGGRSGDDSARCRGKEKGQGRCSFLVPTEPSIGLGLLKAWRCR